jgi:hypothetical protein
MAFAEEVVGGAKFELTASTNSLKLIWTASAGQHIKVTSDSGDELVNTAGSGQLVEYVPKYQQPKSILVETSRPMSWGDFHEFDSTGQRPSAGSPKGYFVVSSEQVAVPQLGIEQISLPAEAATSPSATTLKYLTFIEDPIVMGFLVAACGYFPGSYFDGDGRTFDPSSEAYRTKVSVRIDWLNGGAISWTKLAGQTKLHGFIPSTSTYLPPSYFELTDTANLDRVQLFKTLQTATQSKFTISHKASDPLCPTATWLGGDIEYMYAVTVQRSGNYGLEGYAQRAPAHEAYIRDSNSSAWKTIFQRSTVDLQCLTETTARCVAYINYSGQVL